jgi:hypothetical protein
MAENKVTVVISGEDQTGAVFSKVLAGLEGLGSKLSGLGSVFGGLELKAFADRLAELGKNAAESAEKLAHLSASTGISTQQLSGLSFGAKIAGLDIEDVSKSLFRMAKNMEGNPGAFRSLGVSVRDASGHLRDADSVLEDVADKFSKAKDGPEKTAAAIDLFGRSGAKLIPILNQGKAGIKEFTDEAKSLGIVLDHDQLRTLELLAQNLIRVTTLIEGMTLQFASGLAPTLNQIANAFLQTKEGVKGFQVAGEYVGDLLKVLAKGFYEVAYALDYGLLKAEKVVVAFDRVKSGLLSMNPITNAKAIRQFFSEVGNTGEIDEQIKQLGILRNEQLIALNNQGKLEKAKGDSDSELPQIQQTTAMLDKARTEASKILAAQQTDLDRAMAEAQQKIFDLQAGLAEALKHGLLAPDVVGAMQVEARKIRDLLAEQANVIPKAMGDAGRKSMEDLLRLMQDTMPHIIGPEEQLKTLHEQITAKLEAERAAEEALRTTAIAKGLSEVEIQAKLNKLRGDTVANLQDEVAQFQSLAQIFGNDKFIAQAQAFGSHLDSLRNKSAELGAVLKTSLIDEGVNSLVAIGTQTQSVSEAFRSMATAVISELERVIAKLILVKFFESLTGLFGGGNIPAAPSVASTQGLTSLASLNFPKFAGGGDMFAGMAGIVGDAGPELWIPDTPGTIVPLNRYGSAAAPVVNFSQNIDARGATPGERERLMEWGQSLKKDAAETAFAGVLHYLSRNR